MAPAAWRRDRQSCPKPAQEQWLANTRKMVADLNQMG